MSFPFWPRSKIELLIQEYRNRPILWDCKNTNYHNKALRDKAYFEIGDIINETKVTITKKINNLRSQYLSEFKKIIRTKTSESSYVSKWWAFNLLRFLKENCVINENSEQDSNPPSSTYIIRLNKDMSPKENSTEPVIELEEIYSIEPSPSPNTEASQQSPPQRKKIKLGSPNLTSSVVSTIDSSPKDVFDSYGKYIADELRSITNLQQQQLLKLQIQQLVYYAHKGWLKESDDV